MSVFGPPAMTTGTGQVATVSRKEFEVAGVADLDHVDAGLEADAHGVGDLVGGEDDLALTALREVPRIDVRDHRHLEARRGVDRVGQPADVLAFGVAADRNSDRERIGAVADRVLGRGDQLADPVVGGEAAGLDDQRRLAGVLRPQVARRTGLDADVVRASGHHPRQGAREIREAAFADVAVADEMVDRAAEQTSGRMREQA